MIKNTIEYDHRIHAGNAGDVWKHLIISIAAEHLLSSRCNGSRGDSVLRYAESHAGRPIYLLQESGEWRSGIGRIWSRIQPAARDCSAVVPTSNPYVSVLRGLNPSGLRAYPGSAQIVVSIAEQLQASTSVDLWDIDIDVVAAWDKKMDEAGSTLAKCDLRVHHADGFEGVSGLIECSEDPGLLFIDPPYVECRDMERASSLLLRSSDLGWTVLWWQMMDTRTMPKRIRDFSEFSMEFEDLGMSGGRWKGSTVFLCSPDSMLAKAVEDGISSFINILDI
jgi:23S rRNA (adenine2030-N6)-methyltransferase